MATFLYNFKARFVAAVESGAKRQTVRADRKDGRVPKVGDTAKLYYGLRSKQARLLKTVTIESVEEVVISTGQKTARPCMFLGDNLLSPSDVLLFALADGFTSVDEFFSFFAKEHGPTFSGLCIRW